MRRFSVESDIANPELLRGTYLRKHLATQAAFLDLDDTEVSDLVNFMGHADKIHREHYRIPVASREVNRVSRVLEIGIGKNSILYVIFIFACSFIIHILVICITAKILVVLFCANL